MSVEITMMNSVQVVKPVLVILWANIGKVDILHVIKWSACVCAALGRFLYWLTVITLRVFVSMCACMCV